MNEFKQIVKLIKGSKKIALFSHKNPDPDTIGSTLALRRLLLSEGKAVDLFCADGVPEDYFIFDSAKLYNGQFSDYDLLIAVDIASSDMLGEFEERFLSHNNTLKIDHHKTSADFAKINLVRLESATAIIVFDLFESFGRKIDSESATLLYFSICGDTGIFRYSNTDAKTFLYASKLLEQNADIKKVYTDFFDRKTIGGIKMSSSTLFGAEVDEKLGFVVMTVKLDEYAKYGVDPKNDNLSNLPNSYLSAGMKIAVILKEKTDGVHCSFRSKPGFDVSEIASKFGGGGHSQASGCLINKTLGVAKKEVTEQIKIYLKEKADVK